MVCGTGAQLPREVHTALVQLHHHRPQVFPCPSELNAQLSEGHRQFISLIRDAQQACPVELANLLDETASVLANIENDPVVVGTPGTPNKPARKALWDLMAKIRLALKPSSTTLDDAKDDFEILGGEPLSGQVRSTTPTPAPRPHDSPVPSSPRHHKRVGDGVQLQEEAVRSKRRAHAITPTSMRVVNFQKCSPPARPVFYSPIKSEVAASRSKLSVELPRMPTMSTPAATPVDSYESSLPGCRTDLVPPTLYQARMDKLDVPYHWQWYIATHIQEGLISWTDIEFSHWDKLNVPSLFEPTVTTTPSKRNIVYVEPVERLPLQEWVRFVGRQSSPEFEPLPLPPRWADIDKELAREESSLRNDDDVRLGCLAPDRWYGGKIVFNIVLCPPSASTSKSPHRVLSRTNSTDSFRGTPSSSMPLSDRITFRLAPPAFGTRSTRFARKWGSRRFIHCTLPERLDQAHMYHYFVNRVSNILNRSFRALYAKSPRTILLVETDETRSRAPGPEMISFLDFLAWHNPLEYNAAQPVKKWAARFPLGISDTVPAGVVEPHLVKVEEDIIAQSWKDTAPAGAKPPPEAILTDGQGTMSAELARQVYYHAGLFEDDRPLPSCVQMRIGGCKGMVYLGGPNSCLLPGTSLALRLSQEKIKRPISTDSFDRSHNMFELVRSSFVKSPAYLTGEVMIIMAHGGVPSHVFTEILEKTLQTIIDEFSLIPRADPAKGILEGPEDVAVRLLSACYRHGGVGADRAKRINSARGLSLRGHSLLSFAGEASTSQTAFVAEVAVDMIAAGFNVQSCCALRRKVRKVAEAAIDGAARLLRFPVERSLEAFIVSDPRLKPDEIMVNLSQAIVDPDTREASTHLQGDCLVTRHPCKLPTDVRKFKAVYYEELSQQKNCVIMSADSYNCLRSPASYLGGGDYDGDTVQVFWDAAIVTTFQNPTDESCLVAPPDLEEKYFEKTIETGEEFLQRAASLSETELVGEYQKILLCEMRSDPIVGIYNGLHNSAVYMHGPGHPEAVRLAHLLGRCLDASKSGLHLKPNARKDDARYEGIVPWVEYRKLVDAEDSRQMFDGNVCSIKRPANAPPFIMDSLMAVAESRRREISRGLDVQGEDTDWRTLVQPWISVSRDAVKRNDIELIGQLEELKAGMKVLFEEWRLTVFMNDKRTPSKGRRRAPLIKPAAAIQREIKEKYQIELTADVSSRFQADPAAFSLLKASCAVQVEDEDRKARNYALNLSFATNVAFREVCRIMAGPDAVPVTVGCWDRTKPNTKHVLD